MKIFPCFGEEYVKACAQVVTNRANFKKKKEMYDRMKDRYGYII
jgi:hypothetical protein